MKLNNLLQPKTIRAAVLTILAAIILYAGLSLYSGWDNLKIAVSVFPIKTYLPIILVLVFFGWLIRGLRWHYYLRKSDIKQVPFLESIHVFLASFALTVTPGKVGELIKSVFLKTKYNIPIPKTAGILLMERLMDLVGVLALASFAFFFGGVAVWIFIICFSIVAVVLVLLCFERIYRPLLFYLAKLRYVGLGFQKILEMLSASRHLLKPRIILAGVLFSVLAWSAEAAAFWLVLNGLGIKVAFFIAIFIYAISTIAGAVSMLPGGIGGTEATMIGLLFMQGITAVKAVPAVLLIRLSTLWYIPAVAIIFMLTLLAKRSTKSDNLILSQK